MRDWLVLMAHLIVTIIRIMAPGGARTVIAESLLLKHQLLILNRSRRKAPPLRALDRILLGLGAILVSPQRILKVAVAVRPATLLRFHRALVRRKYQWLFSSKTGHRPGPKGPIKGTDCGSPRTQMPQSALRLPSHCSTDFARLRPGNRQGRGAPDSCKPPAPKIWRQRSVVALCHS